MSKHTPEPWGLLESEDDKEYLRIRGTVLGGRYKIANVLWPNYSESAREREAAETLANAERIIDCVNACAGMTDPAAEIAELKRQRDELLAALGVAIPLIKQARLDWCDQNAESYDEDVVTPYDAILYRPILSMLATKGSAS